MFDNETHLYNDSQLALRFGILLETAVRGPKNRSDVPIRHCGVPSRMVCLQYAPKLLAHRLGTERRYVLQCQELLAGLVRLHILHHAAEGEIYGVWIIEELARHGYRLSPGTLYPMLHTMERKGYLRSRERSSGRSIRRLYRTTALGDRALKVAKAKLRELVGELIEGK
jgi:DNA-binding PadR family transcriptional regulator